MQWNGVSGLKDLSMIGLSAKRSKGGEEEEEGK